MVSRRLLPLLLLVLFVAVAGCETMSGSSDADPTSPASPDARPMLSADTTSMDARVVRLYRLESELLTASDSLRTAHLLDQAMAELADLLQDDPAVIERDAVRDVYRGLTAEYRRFHNYDSDPDSLVTAQGSIFAVRARLFASLENVNEPLLEDAVATEAQPEALETTIPLTQNRLVRQSIAYLQKEPEKHVDQWLRRAQTYFPMIDHILEQEGVPYELRYLAMVESGLNPRARSWASAVGMWQFMSATGRRYGLTADGWVDERRDPEKSTRAAARHLRDLYERFDDWHLAMAAYNCGAGCVSRAVRRTGNPNASFWDIYRFIPRETRGYVPMFIATTRIASNPAAYGFDTPPSAPTYAYDYVSVHGSMMRLSEIADLAGTSTDVIRALNPELRRSTLPPSQDLYPLRIPLGSYESFVAAYDALPDAKKRPVTTYRVRGGDTLSEIAERFGTSTRQLRATNGVRGSMIRVGQTLVVPVRQYDNALTAASGNDDGLPMRVQYDLDTPIRSLSPAVADASSDDPSSGQSTSASETNSESTTSDPPVRKASLSANDNTDAETEDTEEAEPEPKKKPSRPATYTVRRGDTVIEIADRFNLWTKDLRAWNDLRSDRIYVGQKLRLHPPEGGSTATASSGTTYTVRSGDTLGGIAERFNTSAREIRMWNGMTGSRIYPGQSLTIHDDGYRPDVHVVQRGDTLGTIARSYGTSVSQLRRINDLRGSRIYPGQKLKVSTQ